MIRNFPEPPSSGIFSKVSQVQMGGVLRYKWDAYCSAYWRCTAAFPFLQSLEASEAQRYKWGGILRYKLEVYRQYFSDKLYRLGVPVLAPKKGINIKNFARNPPPRPPFQGAHDHFKCFMFGAPSPSKHREKPKHKEFRRGRS